MIDIHSHILFGVDDGAGNAEDTARTMNITCYIFGQRMDVQAQAE